MQDSFLILMGVLAAVLQQCQFVMQSASGYED
jgi:hypothetical protein